MPHFLAMFEVEGITTKDSSLLVAYNLWCWHRRLFHESVAYLHFVS